MKFLSLVAALAMAGGCYTESTTTRTYSAGPSPGSSYRSYGRVTQIQEVTRERRGHPVAGAAAGALLGGAVFGSFGAAAVGGGIGALASSGSSGERVVEVSVQFDNGERGVYDFQNYAPFQPGQRVVATENGIHPT